VFFSGLYGIKGYSNVKWRRVMQVRVKEDANEFGKCGCGRSPTGKCIGWHGLNEEQLAEAKRDWDLAEYTKQAQELWNDSCTAPRKAQE
jgi:hypothetical protein